MKLDTLQIETYTKTTACFMEITALCGYMLTECQLNDQ